MRNRPQTIRNVIAELEELGLTVYGPNIDVESMIAYPSLKNWNAEETILYRKKREQGIEPEESDF